MWRSMLCAIGLLLIPSQAWAFPVRSDDFSQRSIDTKIKYLPPVPVVAPAATPVPAVVNTPKPAPVVIPSNTERLESPQPPLTRGAILEIPSIAPKPTPVVIPAAVVKPVPAVVDVPKPVLPVVPVSTVAPIAAPKPAIVVPPLPALPTANKSIPLPPPPPPVQRGNDLDKSDSGDNPLGAVPDIDKILKTRMTADMWVLMYSPLPCLDLSLECVQNLQQQGIQNSILIRELDNKIQDINIKVEEAKSNNKKAIELSVFEPAVQVFLRNDVVVDGDGKARRVGPFEKIGQLFTNPSSIVGDLLVAVGIPLLRSAYGGDETRQNRAIQISDLTIKVAELERGKVELANKIREKIQMMVLDFDTAAKEFQAEQAIVTSQVKSFKVYTITYASGDGDTDTYLRRKENLERSKLKLFKDWAKLRGQISLMKNMVNPREI
jgi:hypothetical protein